MADSSRQAANTHRPALTTEAFVAGVRRGERAILARTITLVESDAPQHQAQAQDVLAALLPYSGNAIRIGITGVPGVGKSTLIEAFGLMLVEQGHQVAVLAVDPSSNRSHGSILGDKTRMAALSRHPQAYIRPSATRGALGGVARKTREAMLVCEAAGFDVIVVETVGVGQSETAVRAMVDVFVLLLLAGAGDELQAIKKGVVEMADLLVVTKADGDNLARARRARADYLSALRALAPQHGWRPPVLTCSAQTGAGIDAIWSTITAFEAQARASGRFEAQRSEQARNWMHTLIRDALERRFYGTPAVATQLAELERSVAEQTLTPDAAARHLLATFDAARQKQGMA